MLHDESPKKRLTNPKIALEKAAKFCAYQERSQQEVRNKLYEWGLWTDAVEEIISDLIINNFINEERFSKAYSLGKFRMKQWGRIKIKQGLKLKGVSENLIKKGLASINAEDYEQTLIQLYVKRAGQEKESDTYKRKFKLSQYLISRGFESDLVWEVINEHLKK
ncbi:RecX family transcriptional regulator [Solitalea longa]|uniref:Regulatory protein RecX n=1 Tax=Solitalea longa TaxID=2079460 RepID=A0A2S5A643_9SPHI|nr:RecX family transcriptional regulator [Solitalea longa]POY37573.1 RecX family transcriptional regulator [Solitalea longa]